LSVLLAGAAPALHASSDLIRKPGLWEVNLRQGPTITALVVRVLQCTTRETEPDMLLSILPGQENCQPRRVKSSKDQLQIRTRCKIDGQRGVDSVLNVKGDRNSAYTGDFTVHYAQAITPDPGKRDSSTTFDAKWLGNCRPGMKPGDMVLSNGVTVNVIRDNAAHAAEHRQH
jgi:hypothetical protein